MAKNRRVLSRTARWGLRLLTVALLVVFSGSLETQAQEAEQGDVTLLGVVATKKLPQFGGAGSVAGTLNEDADVASRTAEKPLQRWFNFKERLDDKFGLALGLDYTALAQHYTNNAPGKDEAAGGIARLFGTWTLYGRDSGNTGSLTFKMENRHRLNTALAPQDAGIAAGSAVPTGTSFSNKYSLLTNLFFKQRLRDGDASVLVGFVDATDYLDVYGLISPWLHFQNLSFLTNPTIAAPDQGLGLATGSMLTPNIYAVAGIADTNGDPTLSTNPFESFFDTAEYFTHAEIGWTSNKDRIYLDNVHLTWWHANERKTALVPESWGLAFSAATFIDDTWLPFIRAGYSEGGAALMRRSVAAGLGVRILDRDVAGVALAWGDPSDTTLRDQTTLEAFYRRQLNDVLAITPSGQVIQDPALDPDEDRIFVLSLRVRKAL